MKQEYITEIERKLKYRFNDKNLLIQAYTRRSFTEENPDEANNEVLEFIGDAVLGYHVTIALSEKHKVDAEAGFHTLVNEGYLTSIRQKMICGENLSKKAKGLGLVKPEYFRLGKGDIKAKVWEQASVQEDLLESIFGAIAIDCGYNAIKLKLCVMNLFEYSSLLDAPLGLIHINTIANVKEIVNINDSKLRGDNRNPVNFLQELWRQKLIMKPVYKNEEKPRDDGKWWCGGCIVEGTCIPGMTLFEEASGNSKKDAKMNVAQILYEKVITENKRMVEKAKNTILF